MRHTSTRHRSLLVFTLAAAPFLVPSAAQGQLAMQPANVSILVLPPVPAVVGDSGYAVEVGDAVRKRIDAKLRLKLRVISKDKMAEALGNSGFAANAILDENGAQQLARFMNVDAYMTGQLERNANVPTLKVRLVEGRRSGLGGMVTVTGVAGKDLTDFASQVADSIDMQVKAAEQTRECLDRRDKKDYGSAEERAARAFKLAPNHPGASLCLAAILELKKASVDSQIAVYKRAAVGDPLLNRVWDGLARLYQQKGDSVGWASALQENLKSNPTDMRMRFAAVDLLYRTKQFVRSVELLDEGLERSPGDNTAIQLKARSCFDGQLWGCAVTALGERFDMDTTAQNDSLYILKIMVAAQAVNDSATVAAAPASARAYYRASADNVAMEKWTGVAVKKFPNSVSFWRRRAAGLKNNGKNDEAIAAFHRVAQLDPNDFASRIQIAQNLSDKASAVFDSLGRVTDDLTAKKDTVRLKQMRPSLEPVAAAAWAQADSVLSDAIRLASSETRVNIGALIFQPATKLAGKQNAPNLSIAMLEKALPLVASNDQLVKQANFFLGLSYLYKIQTLDFPAITKNKDCAAMNELEVMASRGKAAILAGASVQPATANQLSGIFDGIAKTPPQAKKAWACK
ncbi:MAG: hypothetical protein EXR93_10795 [Gemmatimonadetes bacterium]|nr:hypothetical protein [Gemmatimonadota bacterium]